MRRWSASASRWPSTNGYRPEQASDLYISSGTTTDYVYGMYRIFSYTFEMSIKDYPDDSLIAAETGRNKEAVLYLMERAWCPLAVLGPTVTAARCGAFDDDIEVAPRLDREPRRHGHGAGDRPVRPEQPGRRRAWPAPKQLGTTTSGRGRARDRCARRAPAPTPTISTAARRSARRAIDAPDRDRPAADLPVRLRPRRRSRPRPTGSGRSSRPRTAPRPVVHRCRRSARRRRRRLASAVDLDGPWAGQTIHLRFEAVDGGANNLVEVEIDDVRVTRPS